MRSRELKDYLISEGADLVGIGDISQALAPEIMHLNRGIAIALDRRLNRDTVDMLMKLQHLAEGWLKAFGHRSLSIPPDSDRRKNKCISSLYKMFCHKTAATCSGLGWIGKNGLVINKHYGPGLSWATVLTNAPLETDRPLVESECGDCDLCVRHCPSGALKGHHWTIGEPLKELVSYEKCGSLKRSRNSFDRKPNCGFCITACPYGRKTKGNK